MDRSRYWLQAFPGSPEQLPFDRTGLGLRVHSIFGPVLDRSCVLGGFDGVDCSKWDHKILAN